MNKQDLFDILGAPESEELARLDGKPLDDGAPRQLIKTAGWDNWTDEDEEDLRIIDFGEAFLQGAEPTRLAQPDTLRAPETIFTDHLDSRIDLWRAGIVVTNLYFRSFGGLKLIWCLTDLFVRCGRTSVSLLGQPERFNCTDDRLCGSFASGMAIEMG